MKRYFLIPFFALTLAGCSTVQKWIPSFWDDNQSASIVTARLKVEQIDCTKPQLPQILAVQENLRWFQLYSESKGMLQKDVLRVVEPIKETTDAWVKRGEGSPAYCKMKKELLEQQTKRAAEVILGRW